MTRWICVGGYETNYPILWVKGNSEAEARERTIFAAIDFIMEKGFPVAGLTEWRFTTVPLND